MNFEVQVLNMSNMLLPLLMLQLLLLSLLPLLTTIRGGCTRDGQRESEGRHVQPHSPLHRKASVSLARL